MRPLDFGNARANSGKHRVSTQYYDQGQDEIMTYALIIKSSAGSASSAGQHSTFSGLCKCWF